MWSLKLMYAEGDDTSNANTV